MSKHSHIMLLLYSLGLILLTSPAASDDHSSETVVLVHGILNRPFVMNKIQKGLEKEGFRVLNWGYKSTEKNIEEYADDLNVFVSTQNITGRVHFVGFSLGSIIVRQYLSLNAPPNLGRFVQIAPPNHGSPRVNQHENFPPFRWIYGHNAIEQLKDGSPFLQNLGVPACEFGIITGGKGNDIGYRKSIPGDDDGTVPVASSHLTAAKDTIQIKSQHTLLLYKSATVANVVSFIECGQFQHGQMKGGTSNQSLNQNEADQGEIIWSRS